MKLRFFLTLGITLLITSGILLPFNANATSPASILVNIAPENPTPNENTTISLSSYASNLDSVLISWSVNGKRALSGIGKKSFSVNAPEAGKETIITVTISLPDGSIEKNITIRPAIMMLLWQANDSYVPPFYKGKAMPTLESEIKIVALPEIKSGNGLIDGKNMTYSWKLDYTNDQEGSGYGKNYFTYINDYLEEFNSVSVTANTLDQKYGVSGSIDVGTTNPKILFYKNDAALGTIWEHALKSGHKIYSNEVIEASPYFISPKDIRIPTLDWTWSINDSLIEVPIFRKNLVPLRVQPGTSGTSKIRLEINNRDKIFETATGEMSVEF